MGFVFFAIILGLIVGVAVGLFVYAFLKSLLRGRRDNHIISLSFKDRIPCPFFMPLDVVTLH